MPWIPIGPDFVAKFRRDDPRRLSRRNEAGRNGWVGEIAIHPTNADVIYVVERPSSGGSSAFRTADGGRSWTPVVDQLQQADPHVDPSCIAINPSMPNVVYLGTYLDQGFYVSTDGGDTWGAKVAVGGRVRRLLVDPTTAAAAATTRIYAATHQGLFRSADGGGGWTELLDVDCVDIVAHIPATGTRRFYVGAWQSGLHYSEDPESTWTNLSAQGIGLPAFVPGTGAPGSVDSFKTMRVDLCARNPSRAYVWLVKPQGPGNGGPYVTEGIYTTSAPLTAWTRTTDTAPNPGQGLYNFEFAVAPNSPGNGTSDVLFIGNVGFHRSIDSGVSWTGEGIGFHADQQAMAFFPAVPAAGTVPVLFRGDDGGISRSTRLCDPAFAFGTDPGQYNEADVYTDTGWFENLNHARQDVALYQHTSHPRLSALNYVGCQDTGVAGGPRALGWRSLADADAGAIAVAPGADGLKVWGIWGAFGSFPSFRMTMWTDDGDLTPVSTFVRVGAGGPLVNSTSNYELTPGDECLTGAVYRLANGTLAAAVTADAAPQAVAPSDMTGIGTGSVVVVVDAGGGEERVVVTAVTATSFSAIFTADHAAGAAVFREDYRVVRVSAAGIATPISTNFPWAGSRPATVVKLVAPHPIDPEVVVCATGDNRVWRVTTATTAGAGTAWSEIATDRPAGTDVVALSVTVGDGIYALLRAPLAPAGGAAATPLYRLDAGAWQGQACTGNPANQGSRSYAKLVAHPGNDEDLFAIHGARVYRVQPQPRAATPDWRWTDISDGLPGTWLYDLWTGWVGTAAATRQAILRAAGPTRGVWELLPDAVKGDDVGASTRPELYVRDHLLDQGIGPLETGTPNPYDPTRVVRHYHCADLKVEGIQASGAGADYFQTDPESSLPIDHVAFDMLRDDRSQLGAGRQARLHVQVHNRAATAAHQVRVWTIYANASGGVPGLNRSPSNGNNFPFWNQFLPTGEIIPALPADSPWTAVGPPVTLTGIVPQRPGVASWQWMVPTLSTGDAGHYCAATFIHSSASPIGETGFSVDDITRSNRQIGQKNLHVVTVGAGGAGGSGGGGGGGGAGGGAGGGEEPSPTQRAYVEFHNPDAVARTADVEFDLTALPAELEISIQPTVLRPAGIQERVTGTRRIRPATSRERAELRSARGSWLSRFRCWLRWLVWWVVWRITGRDVEKLRCPTPRPLPPFDDVVYEAETGRVVRFEAIRIDSGGFVAAMLRIHHRGGLPPGSLHHFEVRQLTGGELRGGSTYHVVVAGRRAIPDRPDSPRDFDPSLTETDRLDVPGAGDEEKYIPEAARELTRHDRGESR